MATQFSERFTLAEKVRIFDIPPVIEGFYPVRTYIFSIFSYLLHCDFLNFTVIFLS